MRGALTGSFALTKRHEEREATLSASVREHFSALLSFLVQHRLWQVGIGLTVSFSAGKDLIYLGKKREKI